MKVRIKSFEVDMEIKQKGVELGIRSPDGEKHIGDCHISMTGITWCQGKTLKDNGVKVKWEEFIAICTDATTVKAAVKAAKETGA